MSPDCHSLHRKHLRKRWTTKRKIHGQKENVTGFDNESLYLQLIEQNYHFQSYGIKRSVKGKEKINLRKTQIRRDRS